jgi:hypothetical protein
MTQRLADRIGAIELQDPARGTPQALAALWSEGPALVLFLRHFG